MPRIERTSLYRAVCTTATMFRTQLSNLFRNNSTPSTSIISFDYYSSIGSLLGSNDTIFIFFHLFLAMVRPLLCRMVAKKSGVSQNVSVPWYACILAKLRANVFFSFSLFLEITVPCYYLVVSINVSSSKRNETTTFEVLTRIITSPYFKLRKMKANLKKKKKKTLNSMIERTEFCAMISRATMILKDARRGFKRSSEGVCNFRFKVCR